MKKIILKRGKEKSVLRKHPWVFSGAIYKIEFSTPLIEGDLVEVTDARNNFLAKGFYGKGSIAVRIISFTNEPVNFDFWYSKIQAAYQLRKILGLANNPNTNIYRLFFGEGDGISGLIIDIYHKTAVIQCHHTGIHRFAEDIAEAILKVYENKIDAIYDKSSEALHDPNIQNRYLFKRKSPDNICMENQVLYKVDWEGGQKTGFFIDQRDNRQLLGKYAKDKKVLNAFCYTGGFSLAALKHGAKWVDSVDISESAVKTTEENIMLNNFSNHQSHIADVLKYLKNQDISQYDIVVLDPPAFAKNLKKKHNAVQGYKRLNALTLSKMKPGSMLFTFSCSQVVDKNLFYNTIVSAAMETGRNIKVLHHLSQPADHPVNIYHKEGAYLKGLVLYIQE
ncbi:MAG: class I SAM-dependent rRNA methyltransferase [Bacteroidetes bacterium]|nr:MAG: class I SAM-dependent rRNA methyltransferase [Bacteroidota bacterium]